MSAPTSSPSQSLDVLSQDPKLPSTGRAGTLSPNYEPITKDGSEDVEMGNGDNSESTIDPEETLVEPSPSRLQHGIKLAQVAAMITRDLIVAICSRDRKGLEEDLKNAEHTFELIKAELGKDYHKGLLQMGNLLIYLSRFCNVAAFISTIITLCVHIHDATSEHVTETESDGFSKVIEARRLELNEGGTGKGLKGVNLDQIQGEVELARAASLALQQVGYQKFYEEKERLRKEEEKRKQKEQKEQAEAERKKVEEEGKNRQTKKLRHDKESDGKDQQAGSEQENLDQVQDKGKKVAGQGDGGKNSRRSKKPVAKFAL